jgi:hypothetical protein
MSIITSKQQKRHSLLDPIFYLFIATLILLIYFAALTGNIDYTLNTWWTAFEDTPTRVSVDRAPSFATDQAYWQANCSHRWTSDSACEAITLRSQSCKASVDSAYCSAYNNYLKQFKNP